MKVFQEMEQQQGQQQSPLASVKCQIFKHEPLPGAESTPARHDTEVKSSFAENKASEAMTGFEKPLIFSPWSTLSGTFDVDYALDEAAADSNVGANWEDQGFNFNLNELEMSLDLSAYTFPAPFADERCGDALDGLEWNQGFRDSLMSGPVYHDGCLPASGAEWKWLGESAQQEKLGGVDQENLETSMEPRKGESDNEGTVTATDEGAGRKKRKAEAITSYNGNASKNGFLACPFFKLDGTKYSSCRNHQFHKVKEIKQHLRRKHTAPAGAKYVCSNCQRTFDAKRHLYEHTNRRNGCEAERRIPEAISDQQKTALSQYSRRGRSQADQWYDVWETIFPSLGHPDSPYLKSEAQETIEALREFWNEKREEIVSEMEPSIPHHGTVGQTHQRIFDRFMQSTLDRFERKLITPKKISTARLSVKSCKRKKHQPSVSPDSPSAGSTASGKTAIKVDSTTKADPSTAVRKSDRPIVEEAKAPGDSEGYVGAANQDQALAVKSEDPSENILEEDTFSHLASDTSNTTESSTWPDDHFKLSTCQHVGHQSNQQEIDLQGLTYEWITSPTVFQSPEPED